MSFMNRLKVYFKRFKGTLGKHREVSHQSVFRGKTGERAVTDEHELMKHVDSLGSTASDGLNRLV